AHRELARRRLALPRARAPRRLDRRLELAGGARLARLVRAGPPARRDSVLGPRYMGPRAAQWPLARHRRAETGPSTATVARRHPVAPLGTGRALVVPHLRNLRHRRRTPIRHRVDALLRLPRRG